MPPATNFDSLARQSFGPSEVLMSDLEPRRLQPPDGISDTMSFAGPPSMSFAGPPSTSFAGPTTMFEDPPVLGMNQGEMPTQNDFQSLHTIGGGDNMDVSLVSEPNQTWVSNVLGQISTRVESSSNGGALYPIPSHDASSLEQPPSALQGPQQLKTHNLPGVERRHSRSPRSNTHSQTAAKTSANGV